jgi:phytanoyl-CoA dioxygenase PhyH
VIKPGDVELIRNNASLDIKAWTKGAVDVKDPATYATWTRDFGLKHGMLSQYCGVGQLEFLHDVRSYGEGVPGVGPVGKAAAIWSILDKRTYRPWDMLVSTDGMSLHLPPEITGLGWFKGGYRLHTDQRPSAPSARRPRCIQGLVTLYDMNYKDATFCCILGSHTNHGRIPFKWPAEDDPTGKTTYTKDWFVYTNEQLDYFHEKARQRYANPVVRVTAPAGSEVLFRSDLTHSGVGPLSTRPSKATRLVAYVCAAPRRHMETMRLPRQKHAEKVLKAKKDVFNGGRTTSHHPLWPTLFPVNPQTYGRATIRTIEHFRQPDPKLTPFGRVINGLDNPTSTESLPSAKRRCV